MSSELITRAAAFAAEAHVNQKRKASGQPYVNHLLRVAHEAAKAGLSDEAMAAALLHDVVEDTPVTLEDLRGQFPERVVRLVELLTKWWPDEAPKPVKQTEKPRYYGAILKDPEAVDLKLLDRADNLNDMVRMLPRFRRWAERYLKKTEAEISVIYEASRNAYAKRVYAAAIAALAERLKSRV